MLRRSDLAELVAREPAIRRAILEFLDGPRVLDYLAHDHGVAADTAESIRRKACGAVDRGSLPVPARQIATAGAPIAI